LARYPWVAARGYPAAIREFRLEAVVGPASHIKETTRKTKHSVIQAYYHKLGRAKFTAVIDGRRLTVDLVPDDNGQRFVVRQAISLEIKTYLSGSGMTLTRTRISNVLFLGNVYRLIITSDTAVALKTEHSTPRFCKRAYEAINQSIYIWEYHRTNSGECSVFNANGRKPYSYDLTIQYSKSFSVSCLFCLLPSILRIPIPLPPSLLLFIAADPNPITRLHSGRYNFGTMSRCLGLPQVRARLGLL
jgi:hypothetical protein